MHIVCSTCNHCFCLILFFAAPNIRDKYTNEHKCTDALHTLSGKMCVISIWELDRVPYLNDFLTNFCFYVKSCLRLWLMSHYCLYERNRITENWRSKISKHFIVNQSLLPASVRISFNFALIIAVPIFSVSDKPSALLLVNGKVCDSWTLQRWEQ